MPMTNKTIATKSNGSNDNRNCESNDDCVDRYCCNASARSDDCAGNSDFRGKMDSMACSDFTARSSFSRCSGCIGLAARAFRITCSSRSEVIIVSVVRKVKTVFTE